jgi:hypothetical protein
MGSLINLYGFKVKRRCWYGLLYLWFGACDIVNQLIKLLILGKRHIPFWLALKFSFFYFCSK